MAGPWSQWLRVLPRSARSRSQPWRCRRHQLSFQTRVRGPRSAQDAEGVRLSSPPVPPQLCPVGAVAHVRWGAGGTASEGQRRSRTPWEN